MPPAFASRLQKHLAVATGCGCDGCDEGTKKPEPGAAQPIRIHRRIER